MKDRVCTSCGFVGKPKKQCFESFLVDAFIWATVGSFALMTGLVVALVLPAAWTVFHLLKFKTTKCPSCESLDMVSMTSRRGREALAKDGSEIKVWQAPTH